jgi:hypothetical protein
MCWVPEYTDSEHGGQKRTDQRNTVPTHTAPEYRVPEQRAHPRPAVALESPAGQPVSSALEADSAQAGPPG